MYCMVQSIMITIHVLHICQCATYYKGDVSDFIRWFSFRYQGRHYWLKRFMSEVWICSECHCQVLAFCVGAVCFKDIEVDRSWKNKIFNKRGYCLIGFPIAWWGGRVYSGDSADCLSRITFCDEIGDWLNNIKYVLEVCWTERVIDCLLWLNCFIN